MLECLLRPFRKKLRYLERLIYPEAFSGSSPEMHATKRRPEHDRSKDLPLEQALIIKFLDCPGFFP
jgi:hypothetical protein